MFYLNELSVDGQFDNESDFGGCMNEIVAIKKEVDDAGKVLYSSKDIFNAMLNQRTTFAKYVHTISDRNKKNYLLMWLSNKGPFWPDNKLHASEDVYYLANRCVSETVIAEVAERNINNKNSFLVGFNQGEWARDEFEITKLNGDEEQRINLKNALTVDAVKELIDFAEDPVLSWEQLKTVSIARCGNLRFSEDSFNPLKPCPFHLGIVGNILKLLDILNDFKSCFDSDGVRTPRGHELYTVFFTGDKSLFSDSSDREKREFVNEMTFTINDDNGAKKIFCPWHGKVKMQQIRIHFSWPVTNQDDLLIMYVGPKITKK